MLIELLLEEQRRLNSNVNISEPQKLSRLLLTNLARPNTNVNYAENADTVSTTTS